MKPALDRAYRLSDFPDLLDKVTALEGGTLPPDSPLFDEETLEHLRPHIVRVAMDALNERELEYFVAYLEHRTTTAAAAVVGKNQSTVHRALFGAQGRPGILQRVVEALRADEGFAEAAAEVEQPEPSPPPLADWFRGMGATARGPATFAAVVARSVLAVASELADAKRTVSLTSVMQAMPPAAVDASISRLKAEGWIRLEGMSIRILKTPLEEATR